jgi:ribosome-binding protein aMBF1 (putative translation factor)
MNYPIPGTPEEIIALRNKPANVETIATAIAGVISVARSQGLSLDDLTAELLEDDQILDRVQRRWLTNIVTEAWQNLP